MNCDVKIPGMRFSSKLWSQENLRLNFFEIVISLNYSREGGQHQQKWGLRKSGGWSLKANLDICHIIRSICQVTRSICHIKGNICHITRRSIYHITEIFVILVHFGRIRSIQGRFVCWPSCIRLALPCIACLMTFQLKKIYSLTQLRMTLRGNTKWPFGWKNESSHV